jgi:hypothetical protein
MEPLTDQDLERLRLSNAMAPLTQRDADQLIFALKQARERLRQLEQSD